MKYLLSFNILCVQLYIPHFVTNDLFEVGT